jgi:hypothetical protein
MLPNKITKFKNSLLSDNTDDLPYNIKEAIANLLVTLRPLTAQYLPETCTKQDYEDAEADALLNAVYYARSMLKNKPECAEWNMLEWKRRLYSRFNNAIIESVRYILYPLNIPRPLRFSLKKYSDAIEIIRKYVMEENVKGSQLYQALMEGGCSMQDLCTCRSCSFGFEDCPILSMESKDIIEIHALLMGARKSLSYYAKLYRKNYKFWIKTLEALKDLTTHSIMPDDYVSHDLDKILTLKKMHERMDTEHPDLFRIYCYAMSDTDVTKLNQTCTLNTPKGWLNRNIKDQFNLKPDELRSLLEKGDQILNEFRANEGLPPIHRSLSTQSALS